MKKIIILGSTGSIGTQTLEVIRQNPDHFNVVGLACQNPSDLFLSQIREFQPQKVAIFNGNDQFSYPHLKKMEGLLELVQMPADLVVIAISSSIAILPTIYGLKSGKKIALATKEVLVAAGELIMELSLKMNLPIIPLDSEHNAIYQCLKGERKEDISRLILTASGGPFLHYSKEQMEKITPKQALAHPTWSMGKKISVDSSTLMNKALELIEAHFLFNHPKDKIAVTIHPQSIVHSFVEMIDGSLLAQASMPSMLLPIHVALFEPQRRKREHQPFAFDLTHRLDFMPVDHERFPCLNIGIDALGCGKSMPCFMNKANELLVDLFLKDAIRWVDIPKLLLELMAKHRPYTIRSIEDVLEVEQDADEKVKDIMLPIRV